MVHNLLKKYIEVYPKMYELINIIIYYLYLIMPIWWCILPLILEYILKSMIEVPKTAYA